MNIIYLNNRTRIKISFIIAICINLYVWGQQVDPSTVNSIENKISFHKIVLSEKYITEGASIGDMDADGHPDIIAGSIWWKGPDFIESHAYAPVKEFPIKAPGLAGYADNFFTFPEDLNNDDWLDILHIGKPGEPSYWIKNPGKKPYPSRKTLDSTVYRIAVDYVGNESPNFVDVINDDEKELLTMGQGNIILGIPEGGGENWKILPHYNPRQTFFQIYSWFRGCRY